VSKVDRGVMKGRRNRDNCCWPLLKRTALYFAVWLYAHEEKLEIWFSFVLFLYLLLDIPMVWLLGTL
jgi:hypothetical protein